MLLQSLAMLDRLPDDALDPSTADGAHVTAEVLKLAFADREAWYGDGSPVSVAELLDPAYVDERLPWSATPPRAELRPGSPGGRDAAAVPSTCCREPGRGGRRRRSASRP